MVILTQNNADTHIDCGPEVRSEIRDLLSFQIPGSDFVMRTNPKWNWDGRTRLLTKKNTFPSGLLKRVIGYLEKNDVKFEINDERPIIRPSFDFEISDEWIPRPYQETAVQASETSPRGVYVIGTGGGKTATAAFIIQKKKTDTLFVTPDTGLREQATDDFVGMFSNAEVSNDIKSDAPIVVANIQSLLRKNARYFERFGHLMIDEFHHSGADSYLSLNQKVCNAFYRYGFTGTFMRTDGTDMTMHGVLSDVIFTKSTSELIEEDWLVRPWITVIRHKLEGWSRLNYKAAYDRIIQDVEFNTIVSRIAEKKIKEVKQTLVLVRRKEHGELLQRMIEGSEYISGDNTNEEKEDAKRRFNNRELRCLVATNILGEGQNIPSIDVLINARLQKTEIQTMQGIGRALRKTEGKSIAEIFDFLLLGQRNLSAHSAERIISYRKEKAFKISIIRS